LGGGLFGEKGDHGMISFSFGLVWAIAWVGLYVVLSYYEVLVLTFTKEGLWGAAVLALWAMFPLCIWRRAQ
jgi:hypothetical protein